MAFPCVQSHPPIIHHTTPRTPLIPHQPHPTPPPPPPALVVPAGPRAASAALLRLCLSLKERRIGATRLAHRRARRVLQRTRETNPRPPTPAPAPAPPVLPAAPPSPEQALLELLHDQAGHAGSVLRHVAHVEAHRARRLAHVRAVVEDHDVLRRVDRRVAVPRPRPVSFAYRLRTRDREEGVLEAVLKVLVAGGDRLVGQDAGEEDGGAPGEVSRGVARGHVV